MPVVVKAQIKSLQDVVKSTYEERDRPVRHKLTLGCAPYVSYGLCALCFVWVVRPMFRMGFEYIDAEALVGAAGCKTRLESRICNKEV